jgi:soluble lytic murein transglycosylase
LLQAGWNNVAADAFSTILRRRGDQPWPLYRLSRALADAGVYNLSQAAAATLLGKSPAGSVAPVAVMRLAYPAPWSDLVQRYAAQRGTDPLLLYALMRQESAFSPTAGSSAGAFGLTQFVEPTAREVAQRLDRQGFRFTDLARPALAIEFGAFYLDAQIRAQEGSVYRGLAAYNGGGSSANRWQQAAGGSADPDRFVETIDFAETSRYVNIVMENYAWYRYLYGAADRPSLVR